jgi:RES domain-containing protein
MLSEPDLQAVLQNIKPALAHGPFSRCVGLHHLVPKLLSAPADPQPLWGLGSKQGGGRFTSRNGFETVYLAEDMVTALTEVIAVVTTLPGRPTTLETHPWAIVVVRGLLLSVLDLTRSDMVRKLGSSHQELTGAWRYTQEQTGEAPTQLLGRVCYQSKLFDGIRYSSSKNPPHGVCLAVFPDRLKPPAFLEVHDPHGNLAQRLP